MPYEMRINCDDEVMSSDERFSATGKEAVRREGMLFLSARRNKP